MDYFVLENGKSGIFSDLERTTVDKLYCLLY